MKIEICWELRKGADEWVATVEPAEGDSLANAVAGIKDRVSSMQTDGATVVAVLAREAAAPDQEPGTGTMLGTYEPAGDMWYWTVATPSKPALAMPEQTAEAAPSVAAGAAPSVAAEAAPSVAAEAAPSLAPEAEQPG